MAYFVFNKTSDYVRGYTEHLKVASGGIVSEEGYVGKAAFFSRVLDSAQEGTIWHRLTAKCSEESAAAIHISFYTSEEVILEGEEGRIDLREMMRSSDLSVSDKKRQFLPFLRKQVSFSRDILLHSLEGRYCWFLIEIYTQPEETVALGNFMISFSVKSWRDYLPEIYQQSMENNSFFDRYLAIFQSLYDDVGKEIEGIVDYLDPGTATFESLEGIAQWLDIESPYMWKESQLRFLIEHVMEFQSARGTKRGIELYVELYTGEKPFVIEWQDWEKYRNSQSYGKLLGQLYIDDPGSFTVLVNEHCIPTHKEHQTLLRILEQIKPVQMEVNLVVLKPYIFADGYSYLGVNSVLGQYKEAVLGGSSRLAFATVAAE